MIKLVLFIALLLLVALQFLRIRGRLQLGKPAGELLTAALILTMWATGIALLTTAVSEMYINTVALDQGLPSYKPPTKADSYYFAVQTLTTAGLGMKVHGFENCSPETLDRLKELATKTIFIGALVWGLLIAAIIRVLGHLFQIASA